MTKLSWAYQHGSCTVGVRFSEKRKYDLNLTTLQTSVLMMFNTTDELNYQQILEEMDIEPEELRKILYSLSCNRYKVLRKSTEVREVHDTDVFKFNEQFHSKLIYLTIPVPQEKETFISVKVEADRSFAIEATIVKLLKARKIINHNELVNEVLSMLATFKPSTRAIKERLENLINKEFVERDPDDANLYRYVA